MAEILLSLTIIGVVSAITLPSLTGNINERTWNTQRKALYARFSQAISLMPSLNGYGQLIQERDENNCKVITADNVTETFITDGLSKVLKINNICDNEHLGDCGIPDKITAVGGGIVSNVYTKLNHLAGLNYMFDGTASDSHNRITYSQIDTKAAAFETVNGESVLAYYNPRCISDRELSTGAIQQGYMGRDWIQEKVCANFVYDLNGTKGPNTVGKDIGVLTVFFPTDSIVAAPVLASNNTITIHSFGDLNKLCANKYGSEYRAPAKYDIGAIWVNRTLLGVDNVTAGQQTTTKYLAPNGKFYRWGISMNYGFFQLSNVEGTQGASWIFCIKRD